MHPSFEETTSPSAPHPFTNQCTIIFLGEIKVLFKLHRPLFVSFQLLGSDLVDKLWWCRAPSLGRMTNLFMEFHSVFWLKSRVSLHWRVQPLLCSLPPLCIPASTALHSVHPFSAAPCEPHVPIPEHYSGKVGRCSSYLLQCSVLLIELRLHFLLIYYQGWLCFGPLLQLGIRHPLPCMSFQAKLIYCSWQTCAELCSIIWSIQKDKLAAQDETPDFESSITLRMNLDNCLRERTRVKFKFSHLFLLFHRQSQVVSLLEPTPTPSLSDTVNAVG